MSRDSSKADWIWLPGWEKEDQLTPCLVCFRKAMTFQEKPESCIIRISADTRYKLYVNGIMAEFGPSRGDRTVWFADEVDLAPWLKHGRNVLAVEVLRYPAVQAKGNFGMFRTETPGLYLEELQTAYGIAEGSSWRCRKDPCFQIVSESNGFAPLQILENRKGDADARGWKLEGFCEAGDADAGDRKLDGLYGKGWQSPYVYGENQISRAVSPGNLIPRTIPYLRKQKRTFQGLFGHRQSSVSEKDWNRMLHGRSEVCLPAHAHEMVEIDAGELNTGFLSLRMKRGTGARIRILQSEGYVKPNEKNPDLPIKTDRTDWKEKELHGFTDTYEAAGYGTEELTEDYEPFWFRTFRFVRLEIQTGEEPLIISGFDYIETGYPLEAKAWVETSDETHAAIWDISLRTLKRCMHETYEDCPFYEQLQYAMDSRSQILYTYAVSADDRLARKCMDDFKRSQRYDGMLNSCYPMCGPNVIPGFAIYYIMMLYDHMMYFGDKELLRDHLPAVDGILQYFNRNLDERGLVGKIGGALGRADYWSFIDWTPQWDATGGMPRAGLSGPITMESLLYIMGLMHAADILDYLGRGGLAEEYRSRADRVRDAVNSYCTDEDGMYLDGPGVRDYSQHCQVFALLTDTVSVERGAGYLRNTLEQKERYTQCSVAMAYYLFRALEKAGLYEETDACWELWREMVRNHLTTCVEDGVGQRSDCHAWGALALFELPSVVLGVRPASPGYESIKISPVPGYLSWAKGEAATKWGMVHVEWKKNEDGSLSVRYEVPKSAPEILKKTEETGRECYASVT